MFKASNAGNSTTTTTTEERDRLTDGEKSRSSYRSRPFSSLPRRFSSAKNCAVLETDEERTHNNLGYESSTAQLRDVKIARSLSRLNTLNYDNAAIDLVENSLDKTKENGFQISSTDIFPQQISKSNDTTVSMEMEQLQDIRREDVFPHERTPTDSSWDGSDLEHDSIQSTDTSDYTHDDATRVLNELDTILDIHGATPLAASNSLETKVEDCLLDLDNYLEEMDDYSFSNNDEDDKSTPELARTPSPKRLNTRQRNRSLPMSRKKSTQQNAAREQHEEANDAGGSIERGQLLRRTITSPKEKLYEDLMEKLERTPQAVTCLSSEEAFNELFISEDNNERTNLEPTDPPPWTASAYEACHDQPLAENDDFAATRRNNFTEHHSISAQNDEPSAPVAEALPLRPELRRCHSQNRLSTTSTNSRTEMLTQEDIFNNLLLQNDNTSSTLVNRPRQFGRRAAGQPPVLSVRPDILEGNHSFGAANNNQRPQSAPAVTTAARQARNAASHAVEERHTNFLVGSDVSSAHTSRNSSPITIVSSTDSASTSPSTNGGHTAAMTLVTNGHYDQSGAERNDTTHASAQDSEKEWPHMCSRALALVCCTVGLFNVSRFAVLTIEYGGNFVLQFFLLSILFGIPLFLLHVSLGSRIKAGPVSMWKISPICRGIGISLVLVQCFIAIYSTVAVAWMLIYLRDTFPHTGQSGYMWQEIINPYRRSTNGSANLTESITDYFNVVVLQRLHLLKPADGGNIRFRVSNRLAFNLTLIWVVVFLILCKGLKSFGKAVFLLTILPLIALAAVICKLLYVVDPAKLQNIFTTTDFSDFFENSKMWVAAAQEVFLTWGLLGSSVISITSCTHAAGRSEISLRRDAIFAILITLFSLCLAALLGTLCVQILNQHSYIYVPGSFETLESSKSVFATEAITNLNIISIPPKWMPHYSSFIGESYRRQLTHQESGYQALRFVSEIFPATLILSRATVSWVWAALAFGALTVLGISQLCAMWKPIASALGNSISAVLLSCVTAMLLGVPFTTEIGISILYYMDLVLGGSWFMAILWTAQIFGVFLIRGRPYNGDDLVNNLKFSNTLSAFTALAWNVLLPIGLITLSVVSYKSSFSNQFYYWRGKSYFTYWARKVAASLQIGFLLLIPVTAIVQIYRYLTNGPPDILDRIQLLYRPGDGLREIRNSSLSDRSRTEYGRSGGNGAVGNLELNSYQAQDDAPPKYTPPPSYTTATGARFAKILRQSIRRSVRRVLGDRSRARPILTIDSESNQPTTSLHTHEVDGPHYTSADIPITNTALTTSDQQQTFPCSSGEQLQRSLSLGRKHTVKQQQQYQQHHTIGGGGVRSQRPLTTDAGQRHLRAPYTANDVVTVLRSTSYANAQMRPDTVAVVSPSTPELCELSANNYSSFRSIENLVTNAAPMARSAAFSTAAGSRDEDINESGSNTSVI
ncbi:sodium-dependent transporter bedraggled [Zeugodacus cucurbitae]|uniref:sodium-dependent transporter bedraggled n=1 Tax=Zeugodacus cucurbitae TaxID=28588 RepID=UPI0023D937D7|nr:sodium-dependent transporter bedraggled [Zeugodacus cucurbitae]XP_011179512.2 sodium-dependent transporter bedraggled [Zeugodacus cucurbitae]XP_011179513.2 sodium-dependent transporter bedraggled [Zeugodacus cucurbitae]XP_054089055.1 sodium-dependent transporter bedraggled [Zeugodacus cucurbitae]XP_054089056.1 sodium-dependent transporter bedraggled [Zeugodacus cucurbitae]XP_054089057.1 sodium-dependent transporter bedraggled [Zeugodacus cucurbitae]